MLRNRVHLLVFTGYLSAIVPSALGAFAVPNVTSISLNDSRTAGTLLTIDRTNLEFASSRAFGDTEKLRTTTPPETTRFASQTQTIATGKVSATNGLIFASSTGTLTGTIIDAVTHATIPGAYVAFGGAFTNANSAGVYTLANIPCATSNLIASKGGYQNISTSYTPTQCPGTSTQNLYMTPTTGTLTGTIIDAVTHATIPGAYVAFGGVFTNADGAGVYSLANIPCATSTLVASKGGYQNISISYTPTQCPGTSTQNLYMTPTTGTLTGTVYDAVTNATLSGVAVAFGSSYTTSNSSGVYTLTNISCAAATVLAGKSGYVNASFSYTPPTCPGTSTQNIYMTPVAITTISPNSGPATGGTVVTITGTGLTNGTSVTFGGTPGTNLGYVSSSGALQVTTPAHAAGSVNVVFTGGLGTVTSVNGFTYTSGTGTLTGTVRDSVTQATIAHAPVSFGGVSMSTNSSGVYTLANIPCTPGTLVVAATGYATVSSSYTPPNCPGTSTKDVQMTPIPTITGFTPSTAPATGGTIITINGTWLQGVTQVTFGGVQTTFSYNSNNQLQATAPPHAAGAVDVTVYFSAGYVVAASGFSYTPAVGTTGTLTGTVYNAATNATISGASVAFGSLSGTTNGSGVYTLTNIPCNSATMIAGKTGYVNATFSYTPTTCPGSSTQNIFMTPIAISSILPSSGPTTGGTPVTITGIGLTNVASVTFGGTPGTNISSVPAGDTVNVTTPAHAAGSADVIVTGGYGPVTAANGFTYSGSTTGTLTGTVRNLATNNPISDAMVSFGGVSQPTNTSGAYTLSSITCGPGTLTVSKSGFMAESNGYTPTNCPGTTTKDVLLSPTPTPAPTPDFTWLPSPPKVGEQIQFTDTSTGSPTAWSWTFGDGESSAAENPTHMFATAATYPVKLTVSNSGGSKFVTHNVIVSPASTLQAKFSVSPALPVAGQRAHFTDQSTGGATSWLWEFGTGATSTDQNPDVVFKDAGSYGVKLTVRNATNSDVFRKTVLVVAPDQAPPQRVTIDEVARTSDWPTFGTGAVILTHGWNGSKDGWLTEMATDICNRLQAPFAFAYNDSFTRVCQNRGASWDVWVVDWQSKAVGWNPDAALVGAETIGDAVASYIARKGYSRIHFIAHSAGSALIEEASRDLIALPPAPHQGALAIHETFLDAFGPGVGTTRYGTVARWADSYVDLRPLIPGGVPDYTDLILTHAFNVNITPPPPWSFNCLMFCRHDRPYLFYRASISPHLLDNIYFAGDDYPIKSTAGLGFPLSMENGRSLDDLKREHSPGTECHITDNLCAPTGTTSSQNSSSPATLNNVNVSITGSGDYVTGSGAVLFTSLSLGSTTTANLAAQNVDSTSEPTDSPSIATVDLTTTSPVTELNYGLRWKTGGEGDLRIFVDGVLVRETDERFAALETTTETYVGVGIDGPGVHRIIFRLDGFGSSSSVELTGVQLSYDTSLSRRRSAPH